MPQVRERTANPAGSIPEGLLNRVMVVLGTVLVLALIISAGFCGGGDTAADADAAAGDTPSAAGDLRPAPAVDDELQQVIARQQQALDAAERAAAQRLLADQAAAAAEREAAPHLTPEMSQTLIDSLGVLPDPDMLEIQRQADLEALARRITSVRASPVALSFRGQRLAAPAAAAETADPSPSPELLSTLASALTAQPDPQPPGGELEIPVPSSLRLPDYDTPPRLITPSDPPRLGARL